MNLPLLCTLFRIGINLQFVERVLIHIGYHKTASSWLQNRLFIAGNPVFHPLSKKKQAQSTLASYFIMDSNYLLLHPLEDQTPFLQQELDETLSMISKEDQQKVMVLSEERLSGNPHSGGFDSSLIANRLASFFPKSKVFIVIREQRSWILSNYYQYLSEGGTMGLDLYLNRPFHKRPYFSHKHVQYHYLISEYQKLFGGDHVCVLPYEAFKCEPQSFFQDLGDFVGATDLMQHLAIDEKLNPRKDQFTQYYLRHLNWFIYKNSLTNFSNFSNRITSPLAMWTKQAVSKMIPSSMNQKQNQKHKNYIDQWCVGRFQDSNRRLEEITGLDLAKWGYDL